MDVCEDGTADDPVASGKEKKVVKLQIWDTAGTSFSPSLRGILTNPPATLYSYLPRSGTFHSPPGQESFRSITRSYYRGAFGALLIFSLSSRSSFLSCQSWLEDLRTWGEEGVVILLVGNKGDFKDGEREVGEEEAREWAAERGLVGYTECSALSGKGVEEVSPFRWLYVPCLALVVNRETDLLTN